MVDGSATSVNDVDNALIVEREVDAQSLTLNCVKTFLNKESGFLQEKASDFLIESLSSYNHKQ